jgi:hypothetical protein
MATGSPELGVDDQQHCGTQTDRFHWDGKLSQTDGE